MAHVARVRPFSRVAAHVNVQVALLAKRSQADMTRIRLFACVRLHVPLEEKAARESRRTDATVERPLVTTFLRCLGDL